MIKDKIEEGRQFGTIMYGREDEVRNFPEAVYLNMLGAVVEGGRVVPKGAIVCNRTLLCTFIKPVRFS